MQEPREHYIPALGADWLTPLYDVVAWLAGEQALQAPAGRAGAYRVRTATSSTSAAAPARSRCSSSRRVPRRVSSASTSIRASSRIARRKIERAGVAVELRQGSATEPPFAPPRSTAC